MSRAKKAREVINLDMYIKENKIRRYMTYRQASIFYSMPYFQLVRLAKEANSCWKLRKTALVDMDKLDAYIEKFKER